MTQDNQTPAPAPATTPHQGLEQAPPDGDAPQVLDSAEAILTRSTEVLQESRQVLADPAPADGRVPGQSLDMTKVREFVALKKAKDDLDATLAAIKARMSLLEPIILEQYTQSGTSSQKVDDRTLYMHRQVWASAKDGDKAAACAALKAVGLGDYVAEGFNTQSLSAWVREQEKLGIALPTELAEALNISEVYSLRARK